MEVRGQLHALDALPLGIEPCYSLIKKQRAPHSQSKCFGEKKHFLSLIGNEIQFTGCPDCSPVTILFYHATYVFYNALSNLFTYCTLTCKNTIIRSVGYYLYCTICDRLGLDQLSPLLIYFSESHCYRMLKTRHVLLNKVPKTEN